MSPDRQGMTNTLKKKQSFPRSEAVEGGGGSSQSVDSVLAGAKTTKTQLIKRGEMTRIVL